MGISVLIPTALRQYADGRDRLELAGDSVDAVLSALCNEAPNLKKHLFDAEDNLRSFVNVYVNDEDVRYLEKGATALQDDDVMTIVPSVAGGQHG